MRFTTYSRFLPEPRRRGQPPGVARPAGRFPAPVGICAAAGSGMMTRRTRPRLDALREAILQALMDSGQLTPEMLQVLRGESTGESGKDSGYRAAWLELLDQIVQRLIDEGFLKVDKRRRCRPAISRSSGPGGRRARPREQVQFGLTEKGMDFLGYKTLKGLLGSIGKSSFGAHETRSSPRGSSRSRPAALRVRRHAQPRRPRDAHERHSPGRTEGAARARVSRPDGHQTEYRSSAATVLMLDCSHSMILYGEDRFTPAKKVALALTHLIRTQFPGDSLKVVLFHDIGGGDPAWRRWPTMQVGPYHTNTAEGPEARAAHPAGAEEGHAARSS